MENMDDFMRKKFDSDDSAGRFGFREEYWEQARILLDAAEARRRKRRRGLWWWLFAGVLAVAGGEMLWQRTNTRREVGNNPGKAGGRELILETPASKNNPGVPVDNPASTGQDSRNTLLQNPGAQRNNPENPNELIDNQNFISRKNNNTYIKSGKPHTTPTGNPIDGSQEKTNPAPGPKSATPVIVDGNSEGAATRAGSGENASTPQKDARPAARPSNTGSADNSSVQGMPAFEELPGRLQLLNLKARNPDSGTIQPVDHIIKRVVEPRFGFGLAASASLYEASPDGRRLGGAGGVFVSYRLYRAWSLSAGLQWRFLPGAWGDDGDPAISERIHYSFGIEEDTWILEHRGLHFLEAPLGIRWKRGAFQLEGGLAPGILLGVRGKLTQRHSESLQIDPGTYRSRIWLDEAPYRKFYAAIYFGAEWFATKRLGVTVRGGYRPTSLLKPSDVNTNGGQLWLDAGLRWNF
jgi:hypothetical protein